MLGIFVWFWQRWLDSNLNLFLNLLLELAVQETDSCLVLELLGSRTDG